MKRNSKLSTKPDQHYFGKKIQKNKKVTDITLIPPCASSLMKHTNRAHYVMKMWKQAVMPLMDVGDPSNNGWLPDGGINWIDIRR